MAFENGVSGDNESSVTGTGKRNDGMMTKGLKETRIRRCIRAISRSMATCIAPSGKSMTRFCAAAGTERPLIQRCAMDTCDCWDVEVPA